MNPFPELRAFIYSLPSLRRHWKLINLRKIFYLAHILTGKEKRSLIFITAIIFFSGGLLLIRIYFSFTKPAPQIGGTYTEGLLKEPRTINPIYASQDTDRDIARLVFSGLLTYSGDGNLTLDLAENYSVSKDGRVYTVELKKNLLWHDGEKLDADDVVFTIKTIQNPQSKSPLRANWQGVEVEKIDDYTINFTLRTPYAPFIENLTLGIIPEHLWQKVTSDQALLHELNLKPVGSGPYQFNRFRQEKNGSLIQYELIRNTVYHLPGPHIEKIIFRFFKSEDDLLTAWRRKRIDGFSPLPSSLIRELILDKSRIETLSMPRIFGIFFNQKNASVLSGLALRKALALAIDKKRMATLVSPYGLIAVDSALPPASSGYTASIVRYDYSPDEAKALLREAGWKDTDGDGVLEKKKLEKKREVIQPLRLTLTTSDWPHLIKTAELIKEMLGAVGVEVVLDIKAFNDLEASVLRSRNFEMLLFGQVYGYEPDPFSFWHSSQIKDPGLNISLYSNKNVDRILEEARKMTDPLERDKKYEEFQKIIAQDIPTIFLYSQLYLYLLPTQIKDAEFIRISLPADRFNGVNRWYIKTKRVFK